MDNVEEVKAEIIQQIESTDAGAKSENRASVTFTLQALRQSEDPQQKGMADVLSAISELRRDMAQTQQIGRLENLVTQLLIFNPYAELISQGATTPDVGYIRPGKSPYASLRPSTMPREFKSNTVTDPTPGTQPGTPGARTETN